MSQSTPALLARAVRLLKEGKLGSKEAVAHKIQEILGAVEAGTVTWTRLDISKEQLLELMPDVEV